jgi:ADP-ribose pyrophosphatase
MGHPVPDGTISGWKRCLNKDLILSSQAQPRNHTVRPPNLSRPSMRSNRMTWDIVHRGRKIQVAVDHSTAPDGRTIQRDVVLHPGAVAILPVLDAEHIVLLRNQRFILNEVLWEIPAGTLEPGEAALAAAVRELAEETGYQAKEWRKLLEFYPSPGILSERTHLFVASGLTPGTMRPEIDEQLEPQVVSWSQAIAWTRDGTIRDAKTLIALLWWQQQQGRIEPL